MANKPKQKGIACLNTKQVKRLEQQIWDLKMEVARRTLDLSEKLWEALDKAGKKK